jgi:crotonobetainyl-CoA:carnitine CoA-transferase CaiB-like acyl-CoA transferase
MVKRETGRGQHVDMSMFDSAYTLLFDLARYVWKEEREPQRGSERLCGGLANYHIYQTKDRKYIAVAALETAYKNRLFKILGLEDFIENEATISTTKVSVEKEERIREAMKEAFSRKTLNEWNDILGPENCFYSPLKTVSEALSDTHTLHRGMVREGSHPLCGPFMQLGTALKFSETLLDLQRLPAPVLGQHTVSVLKEIGIDSPEIEELRNSGIIFYRND